MPLRDSTQPASRFAGSQPNNPPKESLMVIDTMDSALFAPGEASAQPDLLVCATLHLMSHYTTGGGCVKLAAVIERHLKALAAAPGLAPVLRATCLQLTEQWEGVVERTMPQPEKCGLLSKLMNGARLA